MISNRSTIPSFGAPLPAHTFDSEYVNQQVTTTTQVHSADFESATGVSLCSGPPAQSKWDDWQTTWCTADVLVEREQESGTSNHWLAVNSKYCTNGAMFTFYPVDETHTVTMDITFGTATSVNVLLFWRCPGGSGTWNNSSFMTNVSGTAGTTSPVSFTFNPSTLSPSASGCEVMIMVRKNSCASTVETFYVDNVNVSYQSNVTQAVLVKAGYRYGYQGSEKDKELGGEGNNYTTYFRSLDVRLGRWQSVDPKSSMLSGSSPYVQNSNSPLRFIDPRGDLFFLGKNDGQAKADVNSLVKKRNQQYLRFDEASGEVSLDFGQESQKRINRILKNDPGLSLVNDLASAKDGSGNDLMFFYGTIGKTNIGLEEPNMQPKVLDYYSDIDDLSTKGGEFNDAHGGYDPRAFILNASIQQYSASGSGYGLKPSDGFHSKVFIGRGSFKRLATWDEPILDSNGRQTNSFTKKTALLEVPRRDIVFHELREAYLRTAQGACYNEAHERAGGRHDLDRFYPKEKE